MPQEVPQHQPLRQPTANVQDSGVAMGNDDRVLLEALQAEQRRAQFATQYLANNRQRQQMITGFLTLGAEQLVLLRRMEDPTHSQLPGAAHGVGPPPAEDGAEVAERAAEPRAGAGEAAGEEVAVASAAAEEAVAAERVATTRRPSPFFGSDEEEAEALSTMDINRGSEAGVFHGGAELLDRLDDVAILFLRMRQPRRRFALLCPGAHVIFSSQGALGQRQIHYRVVREGAGEGAANDAHEGTERDGGGEAISEPEEDDAAPMALAASSGDEAEDHDDDADEVMVETVMDKTVAADDEQDLCLMCAEPAVVRCERGHLQCASCAGTFITRMLAFPHRTLPPLTATGAAAAHAAARSASEVGGYDRIPCPGRVPRPDGTRVRAAG